MAKSKHGKQKDGIGETIRTIVWAILIAIVFRTFLFQPFWIPSGSMKPTLLIGDYLFISKYAYGYSKHSFPWSLGPFDGRIFASQPERGDVIVFKHPRNGEDFIKRLVGLPGDTVQVKGGVLQINGEPVEMVRDGDFIENIDPMRTRCIDKPVIDGDVRCVKEEWLETLPNGVTHSVLNADGNLSSATDNTRVFTVPEGQYFFMGDNRDNSNDSRQGVGFVPFENLVGRAEVIAVSSDGPFYEIWNWRWGRLLTIIR
ncbi:signal peptidase I [Pikeienuella piscinae]|uniref:Signal peptidase I n=1 Tax=Pikeienuella piscinae TaxID=2748098 RepID=A0A7M3T670_9RHOB|nr:signal peptidase I [Pikeienuella piscinae]QIE57501.1 signal peptidase I [Pikeienuella piscinae]